MARPTLTRLCEQLALATGLPAADLKMRARSLRAAGIVAQSARGAGATPATTREGIAMLLAAMAQGPQSDAAAAVARVWALGFQRITETTVGTDGTGAVTRRSQEVAADAATVEQLRSRTLGNAIGGAIDQCRLAAGRAGLLSLLTDLHVWQDGSSAMVETQDGKQIWYGPVADPNAPASMIKTAPIRFMSTVPATVLAVLADATLHPSAIRADEPELPLETKTASLTKANEAVNSSESQRRGNAVGPDLQTDDATPGDSSARDHVEKPSNVIGLDHIRRTSPHGQVEPLRAAPGA